MVYLNYIEGDNWTVCPYLMRISGPETEETGQEKIKHGLSSVTVGDMPAATSSAVTTAAMLGIPMIDADFVGRSVP